MRALTMLIDTALPRAGALRAPTVGLPMAAWVAAYRERRALARLGVERLADLGIEPAAARAEAARPFWDLPRR